jgi:hypothetical protein
MICFVIGGRGPPGGRGGGRGIIITSIIFVVENPCKFNLVCN